MGLLKLGALVRYVPVAIVIGFTNGIAVLIALSQMRDLFGLAIAKMPGDFFAQIAAAGRTCRTRSTRMRCCSGLLTFVLLFVWPRLFAGNVLPPAVLEGRTLRTAARVPGPVLALLSLTLLARYLDMPVETIGSRFGGIPATLPSLSLPPFSWESAKQLVIPTVTIAAARRDRVADVRAHRRQPQPQLPRHDPNQELMAQGVANFVVPFFGGIPATGTIARTVTNLRAGATSPVAGIVHAAHAAGGGAGRRAAGAARAAGGAGRHPAVRGLEHGRVARVRAAARSSACSTAPS